MPAKKSTKKSTKPARQPAARKTKPKAAAKKPARPRTARKGTAAPGKQRRGFALMDKGRLLQICAAGGKASHEQGTGHQWTSEEAKRAGAKGGRISRGGQGRVGAKPKVPQPFPSADTPVPPGTDPQQFAEAMNHPPPGLVDAAVDDLPPGAADAGRSFEDLAHGPA